MCAWTVLGLNVDALPDFGAAKETAGTIPMEEREVRH
jgi:hypothetical protein